MHKLTRITAAVLLSLSMASTGMLTAYADETTPTQTQDVPAVPTVPDPNTAAQTTSPSGDVPASDPGTGTMAADPAADTVATDPTAGTQTADPTQTDAAVPVTPTNGQAQTSVYPPIVFTSDDEANLRAAIRAAEMGEMQPYIGTSVRRINGYWSPSFLSDDTIHNQGNGWYSMQMVLRNELGNLIYRTYSSTVGWSPWVMNNQETPTLTDGSAVEAVQVRMAGVITNEYDLYYRATLSDGTELDWATEAQTSGSMGSGKWIIGFKMMLHPKNTIFPYPTKKTVESPAGTDGVQLHEGALPTYKDGTGYPFTGWGWVNNQRYYFVNDQAVTGWQYIDGYKYYFDETNGKLVSDLRNMAGITGPYLLKINRVTDTLTVYAKDGSNGYILPVVSFLTTTGDDTPSGTWQMPEKYRWRLMYGDVYTQYAMRIKGGFMVHSVIFNHQNPYTLDTITYNNLGIGRSHGCTRLKTGEVKWIYDNCPVGTTITIYDSPINGPFEAPVLDALIPADQNFDPTDPTVPEAVAYMQAVEARAQQEEAAREQAKANAKQQQEAEATGLGGSGTINNSVGNQPTDPIA
ncbi:MAG: L,D-transpeptidase family protein [Lachnospiraceae bacterium]|nr:L,D-transpeptidase family protein [Lachnospiraceae bacterium]